MILYTLQSLKLKTQKPDIAEMLRNGAFLIYRILLC